MKYNRTGIRQRRKELLLKITRQQREMKRLGLHERTEPSAKSDISNAKTINHRLEKKRLKKRIYLQLLGSILLLTAVYIPSKFETTWTDHIKSFTKEALTREYNFNGVQAWLEEKLGQFPAIIPTLNIGSGQEESIPVFSQPLKGTVIETFIDNGKGVVIEAGLGTEVHPVSTGWVRYVGRTTETGRTVIIQHGDGKESVYGLLGNVYVQKDDWVYPDSVIGTVENRSLFLQVREMNRNLDPMDVIPFE